MPYKRQRHVGSKHRFFNHPRIGLERRPLQLNDDDNSESSTESSSSNGGYDATETVVAASTQCINTSAQSSVSQEACDSDELSLSSESSQSDENSDAFSENTDFDFDFETDTDTDFGVENMVNIANTSSNCDAQEYATLYYALISNRISHRSYNNLSAILKVSAVLVNDSLMP